MPTKELFFYSFIPFYVHTMETLFPLVLRSKTQGQEMSYELHRRLKTLQYWKKIK